jgi:hypothetical protein
MTFELIFYVVLMQFMRPWPALLVPPPVTKLFSHVEMVKLMMIWEKSAELVGKSASGDSVSVAHSVSDLL